MILEVILMERKQDNTSQKILDITDLNLNPSGLRFSYDDIYYYHEKTIIHILQKENISEEDYNRLFLLVKTSIPSEHCIANECWLPIAELMDYKAFQEKEQSIKTALLQRLYFIKTHPKFIYETSPGVNLYLLSSDIEKLHLELINMLMPEKQSPVSFNYSMLDSARIHLENLIATYKSRAWEPIYDQAILEQEQDAAPGSIYRMKDVNAYNACKKYEAILKDYDHLIQMIVKMRFHQEFNNPSLSQKLEEELEKSLFSTAVRLNRPIKNAESEKIQSELNKLLFAARKHHEIRQLVQYGANIDAANITELNVHVTVFRDAIDKKLVGKASLLLSLGANPDLHPDGSRYSDGSPNLILAIQKQLPDEFILELIKKTKNVDSKDKYQRTVLEVALGEYRTECSVVIKALIEKGASLSMPGHNGNIPLIEAVRHGNAAAVKYILEKGPELVNTVNSEGETALMIAVQCWYEPQEACQIIDLLVKRGATIDMKDPEIVKKLRLGRSEPLLQQLEKSKEELSKTKESASYGHGRFYPAATNGNANSTASALTPTSQ